MIEKLKPADSSTVDVASISNACYAAMNDDMNTAIVISHLFEMVRIVNSAYAGTEKVTSDDIESLRKLSNTFVFEILGLQNEKGQSSASETDGLMQLIISMRATARNNKDFATSDKIRDELLKLNIRLKDEKDTVTWVKE